MSSGVVLRAVLFIFMGGLVMQWPVTQHLVVDMACHRLDYPEDVCADLSKHPEAEDAVQAHASSIMVWQSIFCDIPGSVSSLLLGAQSDKVGRKRIMLMPVLGVTLLNAVLLAGSMLHTKSIAFVLASSVALGVSGGIGTFMSTVTNYITDVTPEHQRTEVLSKTLPFMGLGMILGLISSGILTQQLSVPAVYFIDLLLMAVVIYLIIFHLKESKPPQEKSDEDEFEDSDRPSGVVGTVWDNLTAGAKVFTHEKDSAVRAQLAVLVVSGMVGMAIMVAEGNLLMLYTKKSPFGWSPSVYTSFMALRNVLGIVGQAGGTALFFKVVGEKTVKNDFILLLFSSAAGVAINIATAMSTSTMLLMSSCTMVMFASPAQSASGSITSKLVSPAHKGAFMSLGTFLNTLSVPVVGYLLNSIYSSSVQTHPGLVFFCIAGIHSIILAAITYVLVFTLHRRAREKKVE